MDERLDPVLRAVATTRTDLSNVGPVRAGLDERRRAAVADIDATGVAISDTLPTGCGCGSTAALPRRRLP